MFGIGVPEILILILLPVTLILVFGIPILVIYGLIRLLRKGERNREYEGSGDEARMIQEIHSGLMKMEDRVSTLETLLLERKRMSEISVRGE